MTLVPKASHPKLKIIVYLEAKKKKAFVTDLIAKMELTLLVHQELGEGGCLLATLGVSGGIVGYPRLILS